MSRTRKALLCGAPRLLAALLLCGPGWALAHSPIAGLNHFYNGVLHPAVVPAHALAAVALGLLCTQLPAPAARRVLAAFLSGVLIGLAAQAFADAATGAGQALLAGAAVLGLLVAAGAPAAARVLPVLATVLGLCLGLDSVPEATAGTLDWTLTLAGQAIGVCLITSAALLLASRLEGQAWQRVARQMMGSWIAASALMVLALGSAALPMDTPSSAALPMDTPTSAALPLETPSSAALPVETRSTTALVPVQATPRTGLPQGPGAPTPARTAAPAADHPKNARAS